MNAQVRPSITDEQWQAILEQEASNQELVRLSNTETGTVQLRGAAWAKAFEDQHKIIQQELDACTNDPNYEVGLFTNELTGELMLPLYNHHQGWLLADSAHLLTLKLLISKANNDTDDEIVAVHVMALSPGDTIPLNDHAVSTGLTRLHLLLNEYKNEPDAGFISFPFTAFGQKPSFEEEEAEEMKMNEEEKQHKAVVQQQQQHLVKNVLGGDVTYVDWEHKCIVNALPMPRFFRDATNVDNAFEAEKHVPPRQANLQIHWRPGKSFSFNPAHPHYMVSKRMGASCCTDMRLVLVVDFVSSTLTDDAAKLTKKMLLV
jgi:hypothetical protein